MADALYEIGGVQQRLGNYELARMAYQDALRNYSFMHNEFGLVKANLGLATLAILQSEVDVAISLLDQIVQSHGALGNTDLAEQARSLLRSCSTEQNSP